jgi:putative serine protease PepD
LHRTTEVEARSMTIDTEGRPVPAETGQDRIETGRSWRDLPDAPPEADPLPPMPATTATATVEEPAVTDTLPQAPVAPPPAPPQSEPDEAERSVWPWLVGLTAALGALALLLAWSPWSSDDPLAGGAGDVDSLLSGDEPVAAVAADLLPSVVQIENGGLFGATGSGFVYEPGRVLTAAHVVAGASEVTVRSADGTDYVGIVLGGDPLADIAVVAIDADLSLADLALGEDPEIGQLAVAIGSPLGFEQSVTSGIVSAIDREIEVGGTTLDGLIQTDAPINQGNSGGPLADRQGRVIGVNVAIASLTGGSDGLGFAVDIDKAVEIAAQFTEDDPRPETVEDLPNGLFPPGLGGGLEDLLDDFFGGEGAPFANPEDLDGLLEDFFGNGELDGLLGEEDLNGLLDDLLGSGELDGLLDEFGGGTDNGEGLLSPELIELLLRLLGGDGGDSGSLNDLFDLFQGEG